MFRCQCKRRAKRCIGCLNLCQCASGDGEVGYMANPLLEIGTNDMVVRGEAIGKRTKYPLWLTKLGLHGTKSYGLPVLPAIEVPPTCAIRYKVQHIIGGPCRLVDRFCGTTRDTFAMRYAAIRAKLTYPQFCAIPGHIGMIPGKPGQAAPIRAEARV